MILALRILCVVVILSMLAITTWASMAVPLFDLPREVYGNPWFLATLLDAYWGFIAFWVWVAWKERRVAAGAIWLVAILLLGNFAMAAYALRELFTVERSEPLATVFARRNSGHLLLPSLLCAAAIGVYLLA
ncbi:DUF1475 family protein [Opitutales bacterium ASA1]|uniref:DUF1475 family protein n=1 Tax=Congregicoccus parvus TaxID=3081749 RepID=UPI002B2F22D8|nr:DUF1475 family protein [Opitutales bacterium ASA1]